MPGNQAKLSRCFALLCVLEHSLGKGLGHWASGSYTLHTSLVLDFLPKQPPFQESLIPKAYETEARARGHGFLLWTP